MTNKEKATLYAGALASSPRWICEESVNAVCQALGIPTRGSWWRVYDKAAEGVKFPRYSYPDPNMKGWQRYFAEVESRLRAG